MGQFYHERIKNSGVLMRFEHDFCKSSRGFSLLDLLQKSIFDHKGMKSQRLEKKNFVALCLGDFVVKLLTDVTHKQL